MMPRFQDTTVFKQERFSLGRDTAANNLYLSIPVANRLVDYEEYYRISEAQYEVFIGDTQAAAKFANECRARQYDQLLILKPGSDRGVAV